MEEELILNHPESFLEIRQAAERASIKFKCRIDELSIGLGWGEIAFYPPNDNSDEEDDS